MTKVKIKQGQKEKEDHKPAKEFDFSPRKETRGDKRFWFYMNAADKIRALKLRKPKVVTGF